MSNGNTGYMLDTHVFNRIADGEIPLATLKERRVVATHVQRTELERTSDPARRQYLLSVFRCLAPENMPTKTAPWDDTPWDESEWSSSDDLYDRSLVRIQQLDQAAKKKPRDPDNQTRDARIAEAAIRENLILVTNDPQLSQAAREHGCRVIDEAAFVRVVQRKKSA
jgi:predicted nucleic acid-binding protein